MIVRPDLAGPSQARQGGYPRLKVLGGVMALAAAVGLSGCRGRHDQRQVWAEVNRQPIFRDEVERAYRQQLPGGEASISGEQALSLKLSLLNELIDNQLLVQRAVQMKIVVAEGDVDHQIAQLSSPYSAEEFQKRLAGEGLTPAELRAQVRQKLLVAKLLQQEVDARIQLAPAEIDAYYHAHSEQFTVPETRYHLAQILVTAGRDPALRNLKQSDAVGRVAAEQKARLIAKQLHAGADFAQLAAESSEDPATASGGGDMGFLAASALSAQPKLRQVVSGLKVGQVSGAVRDQKGDYHILKLLGREDAGQRPLTDAGVQKTIRDTLSSEREQVLKAAYLEDLRNRAKVKDVLASQIVAAAGNPAFPN